VDYQALRAPVTGYMGGKLFATFAQILQKRSDLSAGYYFD
jgi:hypothetical protein